jgi:uncharacterized protein YebE (UPF0316 family)
MSKSVKGKKLNVNVDNEKDIKGEEEKKNYDFGLAVYTSKNEDGRNEIEMQVLTGKKEQIQFSEMISLLENAKFEIFSSMFGRQLADSLGKAEKAEE